jgi:serine/threonine protein kinase
MYVCIYYVPACVLTPSLASSGLFHPLTPGGELFERIAHRDASSPSYSESHAKRIIAQILSAVDACHKAGVAHRDIKPENILCATQDEETSLRLIDFGCASCIRPIVRMYVCMNVCIYEWGCILIYVCTCQAPS